MSLPLVAVLHLDEDGRVVDANDDAIRLLRCPPTLLRGARLALTEDGELLRPVDVAPGGTHHAVATLEADGATTRLAVVATRVGGVLSIVANEGQVEVSARLRAAVADFQELFAKVPASMLVYRNVRDRHGAVVDFELLDANELAAAWLGRRRAVLIGARLRRLVPGPVLDGALAIAEELDDGAPVVTREVADLDRRVFATTFPLSGDRFASIRMDVTDLQRAREVYERAERMSALGELASGVGHDFRNILWAIGLYARGIALAHPAPDPGAAEAAQIAEAVSHGMSLTGQLLDFARRERQVDATPVDVAAVVTAIAPMLGRLLGERRPLSLDLADGLLVAIDPTRLEQVLINLTVNARDAMPDGGRVSIGLAPITIAPDVAAAMGVAAGRHARLAIADEGTGMEPAVAARIFEPYFTTKGAGRGTGLGLATAFAAISAAGGSIAVTTAPAAGSTFAIHLPLAGAAAPVPDPVAA